MTSEDLEFSISQYLDGTLAEADRVALESRLASHAGARDVLAEYRRLDAALKSRPLPDVRWELLADSISSAIDDQQEEQQRRTYRLPAWVRFAAPLSLAASVLIATGVAYRLVTHRSPGATGSVAVAQASGTVAVEGPKADVPEGPVEVIVSVGPGKAVADEPILSQYSEDVVSRPSRVTVASGASPVEDSGVPDMQ